MIIKDHKTHKPEMVSQTGGNLAEAVGDLALTQTRCFVHAVSDQSSIYRYTTWHGVDRGHHPVAGSDYVPCG